MNVFCHFFDGCFQLLAGDQLEEVMGKRTRAIERKLRQVEQLPHEESMKILPIDDGDDESTD